MITKEISWMVKWILPWTPLVWSHLGDITIEWREMGIIYSYRFLFAPNQVHLIDTLKRKGNGEAIRKCVNAFLMSSHRSSETVLPDKWRHSFRHLIGCDYYREWFEIGDLSWCRLLWPRLINPSWPPVSKCSLIIIVTKGIHGKFLCRHTHTSNILSLSLLCDASN